MSYQKKIIDLKREISDNLNAVIDSDYIYLDLPYYNNIGDVLIWKGAKTYLETLPHKCLYESAIENFIAPNISEETIIIFQGGGNFGDLWRRHTAFVLDVIDKYPKNRVVIFPQTIYYQDESVLQQDALVMNRRGNVTICGRDRRTFDLLNKYFLNCNNLLVPDTAFFIDLNGLKVEVSKQSLTKSLLFKRNDSEKASFDFDLYLQDGDYDSHDWPSMERPIFRAKLMDYLLTGCRRLPFSFVKSITNWYANSVFFPAMLSEGVQFLSKYNYIYTTRLHGAILSILLSKEITFFDNSYGKNKGFYDTWLSGVSGIEFIDRSNVS
ncbi:polysaccharide pyruvyl transferase family protein [Persicobacter psychrovividus]|uniref:Pyruvyl transferase EpsO n=1 Tax=Persicobacter psychrovividus TaxID=387638 RepID=A0ABM7VGE0_9BACT|nr:putative pyruvyl transferase EpsO [Persicobacter psychrovividus]